MKSSTLNPLASSFVPSKAKVPSEMVSLGKVSFKNMANKYLQDLIENKKKKNDNAITREEISAIVMKLMEYGNKKLHKFDPVVLKGYLRSKVPEALSIKPLVAPKDKEEEPKLKSLDVKIKEFDLSVFKIPKESILLVSLWGLYRQEQALRPMISLTHRPEPLEDRVWSVTPKDLHVWNAHAVEKPCDCPPMFGYAIPPSFFGNFLKVESKCCIDSVHLNRYPVTPDGNEMALVPSGRAVIPCTAIFEEPEDIASSKGDLDFYLKEFKMVVENVCKIISEEKKLEDTAFEPSFDECDFMKNLWDSDVAANRPKADQVIEDDNVHPLLDGFAIAEEEETKNEGIATNIKDLIHRSFSSETTDSGISEDCCDPPCSHWCLSSPKCNNKTREALDILNDTTKFLSNFSSQDSGFYKPAPAPRPNFKRSFSANDCEAYQEKIKFSTKGDTLSFLRKDPINYFNKMKDPSDNWKDSDSGIVSNCSSQDDFRDYGFEEGDEYLAEVDMAPMWSLFSGNGSLWQPLLGPNQDECIKFPHKRVKELRRLQSMT